MKIMQIMPEFGLAGAETMCENLSYELVKLGHSVIVVSLYDYHSPITQRLEDAGVDIRYLNKKPGLDFSMIKKLTKLFRQEKPDAIHTHRHVMQYAIPAASIAGIKKKVHTFHSIAKKENTSYGRKLNKIFFKYCHVIPVALSELVRDTVVEEYKLTKEKIPVILNGVDLSKCILKTDYSIKEKFTVLHIGRFMEVKNHIGLVKAFEIFHAKHPQSVLKLIGDGPLKNDIEQYVSQHKLEDCVEFLGLKSDVHTYLHDADVFVLPSLYEGIPMSLIEAMGTGLPIIATNVGGIPDMLKNEESALLIQKEPNEVANALDLYADNKEIRESYGKKALEKSKTFSSELMAKKYSTIYQG